nr:DUF4214 domain-containing protein [Lachnospiraceae bacterium]
KEYFANVYNGWESDYQNYGKLTAKAVFGTSERNAVIERTEESLGYLWTLSRDEVYALPQKLFGGHQGQVWWTRTPDDSQENHIWLFTDDNFGIYGVSSLSPQNDEFARCALYLDPDSIIMLSSDSSPKSISGKTGTLIGSGTIENCSGADWKLTLKDEARNGFKAQRKDYNSSLKGSTVTVAYSGAMTGDNEFVSAVITDASDDVIYYGHIADCSTSPKGTVKFSVPNDSSITNKCKLYVFSEQCNDGMNTDYSSKLIDLTKPVPKKVPGANDLVVTIPADLEYDGTAKPVSVAAASGVKGLGKYRVKYFDSSDRALNDEPVNAGTYKVKIDVTDEGTVYTTAKDITSDTWIYTISKKPVTLTAADQTVALKKSILTSTNKVKLSGLVSDHKLSSITLTSSDTAHATTKGTIQADNALIMSGEQDVTSNYEISYVKGKLTVKKGTVTYSAPTAENLKYNGLDQPLIKAGKITDCEGAYFEYKLGLSGTYSKKIPEAKDEGEYTVYYRIKGGNDYNDTAKASVNMSIEATLNRPMLDPVETFCYRVYQLLLERDAYEDLDSLRFWSDALKENNLNGAKFGGIQLVQMFIVGETGKEYTDKKKSNEDFLLDMYTVLMGRDRDQVKTLDGDGFNYWLGRLDSGESKEYILKAMGNCNEFVNICKDAGIKVGDFDYYMPSSRNINLSKFVSRMYSKCLGRDYEDEGLNFWVGAIMDGSTSIDNLCNFFFNCEEFNSLNLSEKQKIERLYATFFDREPDEEGMNFWLNGLADNSQTWSLEYYYFAHCKEFAAIKAGFGL